MKNKDEAHDKASYREKKQHTHWMAQHIHM